MSLPLELVRPATRVDDKTFATLRARAALIGVVLLRTEADDGSDAFIVTRDALCRSLGSAAEVDSWIKRAGGPNA